MNQSVQSAQSSSLYVHAYAVTRSPSSFQKFNVIAVDRRGELLATIKVDLDFEDAALMVETLNGDTQ